MSSPDILKTGAMLLILSLPAIPQAQQSGTTHMGAGDMQRCEEALDALQIAAREAMERAAQANRKFSELDRCQNRPDDQGIKDQFGNCDSLKWEYQNEAGDVELELQTLGNRLKTVQLACGYEFGLKNSP